MAGIKVLDNDKIVRSSNSSGSGKQVYISRETGIAVYRDENNNLINIATGQPLKVVKTWKGLVSQSGTGIPTADVLCNELGGDIVFSRSGAGEYLLTLAGAWPDQDKTFLMVASIGAATFGFIWLRWASGSVLRLTTTETSGAVLDGQLDHTAIEIQVFE